MVDRSIRRHRIAVGVGLWTLLYLGISVALVGTFSVAGATSPPGTSLVAVASALGVVVTGLALLAVVADRLLFSREPTGFLTRQSVWVIVLVGLTVVATGIVARSVVVTPGNAVLLGIVAALPTTIVLFSAVNVVRYRSMEHRG